MSRQLVSDKNEKSLGEMVIIILMVAVLMMIFIHYFFKQEDQITRAGFNALTQNFSTKVTAVRAQWFMDKQPSKVQLMSSGELQSIYVNKLGWIDSEQENSACQNIWAIVMGESLHLMNVSIKVDEVPNTNVQHNRICKYSIPSGEFFKYNTNDGKVISAILINSPTQ